MIGGRLKGSTLAPGMAMVFCLIAAMMAVTVSVELVRWSNGNRRTTRKALLDSVVLLSWLKPMMDVTAATPFWARMIFSTSLAIASVRFSEAPGGSWTSAKKAPWSSSGRNPVGITRNSAKVAPAASTITGRLSVANLTIRRMICA